MNAERLSGLSVLILEDDYYLAEDSRIALNDAGATVLGPCRDAAEMGPWLDRGVVDCALVDVNLGLGPDFAPARTLLAFGTRVMFITGYDKTVLPEDLAGLPRLEKPVAGSHIVAAVAKACGR